MKTMRLAVFVLAVLASRQVLAADPEGGANIPQHTEIEIAGLHAYADKISARAGDPLTFYVSADQSYTAGIYRLGPERSNPSQDELIENLGSFPVNPQPIRPGSYIHVENWINQDLKGLTLEVWAEPAVIIGWSGIITQYSSFNEDGYGLFIGNGQLYFYLGRGRDNLTAVPGMIEVGRWYHVVATWNGREKAVWVNGQEAARWPYAEITRTGKEPLRLGAYGSFGKAGSFFNGTMAMPVVYDRALTPDEIQERYQAQDIQPPKGKHVLAAWPLDEEDGDVIHDVSGNGHDGRIINHATWQVGGPRFNPDVPRFGYDPKSDPTRGHGLRFAQDDLVDCGWTSTIHWTIPASLKTGVYVLRLQSGGFYHHVPFIVRRGHGQEPATIAVIASTNTWWAYNIVKFPFSEPGLSHNGNNFLPIRGTPWHSFYQNHSSGQGNYYVGLRTPNPSSDPYFNKGEPDGVAHLLAAERPLYNWLDQQGYEYEILAQTDIDKEPNILEGRSVVIIIGHSEYWSADEYRAIEAYMNNGGRLVVLSGNVMFWIVSFDEHYQVMEGRKVDAPGARVASDRHGERFHLDGQAGGLMREVGYPGWELTGLECVGWFEHLAEPNGQFGSFVVEAADHPLFSGTSLNKGDEFGLGAVGHEYDALPSTVEAVSKTLPLLGPIPKNPEGVTVLARTKLRTLGKSMTTIDWWGRRVSTPPDFSSEVILWERPEGGTVFNLGSIRSAVAFSDPKFGVLFANVLERFGVRPTSVSTHLVAASAADLDGDGIVGFSDFVAFAAAFEKRAAAADVNGDGTVTFADFLYLAQYFGQRVEAVKPAG